MDLRRARLLDSLMEQLKRANEVEYAADMDVEDSKANVAFYERQLEARKARRDEAREATQAVLDKLGEVITAETVSPLHLAKEIEDRDEA